MNALELTGWLCGAFAAFAWLASLVSHEYSWTDRIWSIAPIAYLWIFAASSGWQARSVLMAVLVTAWGLRLTANFARKGGFRPGGEDYRWSFIRSKVAPAVYQWFNLLFIAGYQNLLIWAMTLPAWTVAQHPGPMTGWDWLIAAAFLAALVGETVADQQQWRFHARKAQARAEGRVLEPPFCDTGLFAWSRHPNYFFEQAQWWIVYLFAITATGRLLNWTIVGAVFVTLLFIGSTKFTEYISAGKYPTYRDYQRRVSAIIPLPSRPGARVA